MVITGGPTDETLTGTSGDDVIDGAGGADTMIGLAGNDKYYVDDVGDQVTEATGQGTDHVYSTVDYTLAAGQEIESLRVYGVATGLTLTGNGFGNYLVGGAGSDTLNGGGGDDELNGAAGADIMAGGTGNDKYYVDNAADQITEATGQGTDHVYSTVDYTLAAGQEIESLRVYGSAGLALTGNGFGNYLVGGAGSDTLNGAGGDDELNGAAGADIMAGGIGNDKYYVDNAADQTTEATGQGTDHVYSTVDYTLAAGQEVESLRVYGVATGLALTGNELGNYLVGGAGDDTLNGAGGDDELNGAAGADIMAGGTGNDRYYVDNAGDQTTEATGQGTDHVYSTVDYTLAAGQEIESLRVYGVATGLTLTGNELGNYLVGGAGDDALNGAGGDDELNGAAGADIMAGGIGNDKYYVDNAGDQVIEVAGGGTDNLYASVSYTLAAGQEIEFLRVYGSAGLALTGNELANTLIGGTGSDTLDGGGGNDTLFGGLGVDTMTGGVGNDVYTVDNAGDQVIEALGDGSDTIYASVDYTLAAGQEIEALQVYGSAGLTLTGNGLANALFGGSGGDTLDGGAGADTMAGGSGNDSYTVDDAGDQVIEAAGGGSDTVHAGVDYTLAAGQEVEFLRVYGSAGLALTGNELANALFGGSGDDTLDGGIGADTMAGGSGNDGYTIDTAGDQVIEAAGGGSDTIHTTVDYTLAAGEEIESLRVDGETGLRLTGNDLGMELVGGAGSDTLTGGAGDDTIMGGGDTSDTMNGGAGDDHIMGGAEADIIDGGAGADIMNGGDFSVGDTFHVDNVGDQIAGYVINATIYTSVDFIGTALDSATVHAVGSTGLHLTGGQGVTHLVGAAGDDTLTGGSFVNSLDGGAGADILIGGVDADYYYVDNAGDQVIEAPIDNIIGKFDTIHASVDYTLAAGQEVEYMRVADGAGGLRLTGNDLAMQLFGGDGFDTLTGGAGDDIIEGGRGGDILDGGAGADIMRGGRESDTYYVDNAGDQVIDPLQGLQNESLDIVYTSVDYTLADGQAIESLRVEGSAGLHLTGNDFSWVSLIGGTGSDTLTAGSKGTTLDGGAGADMLIGGANDDTFIVDNAGDQVIDSGGADKLHALVDYTLAAGLAIESLSVMGQENVHLTGNEHAQSLIGSGGNDTLTGGAGNDRLNGGWQGNDVLVGGAGIDTFVFDSSLNGNSDSIQDFDASNETIELSQWVFTGFTAGALAASQFALNSPTGSNAQIVYDTASGALSFRPQNGDIVQFATIANHAGLSASSFVVV